MEPYNVVVNAEVAMNKVVTHPGHGTPFQMAIPLLDLIRELFHRFPNNLQTPDKRALQRYTYGL